MIGIAIIGGGRAAHFHHRGITGNPGTFRLKTVVDVDAAKAAELGTTFGCTTCTDYRRVLEDPEIDAVTIALPNHLHCEATVAACAAGKHVLVEKPMALTLEECDRMAEAAQTAGVKLMVGHTQHFFPQNIRAKELIDSRAIGDLCFMTDTWYKPFGLSVRLPWFLENRTGGGMWQMNGSHMIDRMIWYGNSPIVAVKAWIGNSIMHVPAADSALAMLTHASGLTSVLTHAGYRSGDERWEGEFIGSDGMIRLSTFPPNPGLWMAGERYEPVPTEGFDEFAREFAEFADCIVNGTAEPVDASYARHIVQVLLAAEESSRTGREVIIGRKSGAGA